MIKLRHVNIHRYWLRQEVQKRTVNIQWTSITNVLVDDLTKALSSQRHKKFVKLITLQAIYLEGVEELTSKKQHEQLEEVESVN